MKNILIADAGSTKIDWVKLSADGTVAKRLTSDGINALLADDETLNVSFAAIRDEFGDKDSFSEIYYYGAGCASPEICDRVKYSLLSTWNVENAFVTSDLTGAARTLFGDTKGIACILGTGSNSGLYDGTQIVYNVPSLGYMLGDEGSGAVLGKRLVSDVFKKQLPDSICQLFTETFNLTLADILSIAYHKKSPNKFFASLVPFIFQNLWNPYVYAMVLEEFKLFFRRNIAVYKDSHRLPIGFIGSIASNFEKILREAAAAESFEINKIFQSPMEGLVEFHSKNLRH